MATLYVIPVAPQAGVAVPVIDEVTGRALTVTVASDEFADGHTPLVTTARYLVVWVRLVAVNVLVVLLISTVVSQLLIDDCHLVTVPVWPDKVNMVLLVPEHTAALPAILPPTDVGLTVTVIYDELASAHAPLFTTARK